MSRPPRAVRVEDVLDRPIPDLHLPSTIGDTFGFRQFVGAKPLVLFFYIRDATPG